MSSEKSSQTVTEADQLEDLQRTPSHWRIVASHSLVTPAVLRHPYSGSGTVEEPYVVEFIPGDKRNPMGFPMWKKWVITLLIAFATLAVSFVSSAYTGGLQQVVEEFGTSEEVVTLGVSLFVLGFAIGPLLWAPLSELYGRQILFLTTYGILTVFNAGVAGSRNIETLVILRFFAGAFGSSVLTNSGGVIADMFPASQRGLAMSVFAAAPFMGPTLGPIAGGFLGETKGWRWVEGLMAIFTGALWIIGILTIPETYAPVLLRKRAQALCSKSESVYVSKLDVGRDQPTLGQSIKIALSRPWILLVKEPIVLSLSIYMAIIYGILYLMFAAFPIVFQEQRGWSQGVGALPFCSVAVGMLAAVAYTIPDNNRYINAERGAIAKGDQGAAPEARLPPCIIGCICIPIGLFIFSWTNSPDIHWIVCVLFTSLFGFGMVLVFLGIMNYLIDAYTIYAASVLAANSILRSLLGAVFPLFTAQMYDNLGIHLASTVPAILAVACVPFPFLFYLYGPSIRKRCKFAKEGQEALEKIRVGEQEGLSERPQQVDDTASAIDKVRTDENDTEKAVVFT
ncbi:MFS siderochrome iron transporter 1 [Pseudocyphellaria aurata]|nr:MFS siderochrome iron transporter 1 [Pseudocyphellaria aurata]